MQGDEKVIELRQKPKVIATTNAGPDGLYKVVIKPLVSSSTLGEEDVCIVAWGGGRPHVGAQPDTQGINRCESHQTWYLAYQIGASKNNGIPKDDPLDTGS